MSLTVTDKLLFCSLPSYRCIVASHSIVKHRMPASPLDFAPLASQIAIEAILLDNARTPKPSDRTKLIFTRATPMA
jgi:hypothetical protein